MFRRKKQAEVSPPITPCPDCSGPRVHVSGSYEMQLVLPTGGRSVSRIEASACLECGRVYPYAVDIGKLRAAFPDVAAAARPASASGASADESDQPS